MIVVSDTSPIRALNHLELLPLLGELYGKVVVPHAIQRELSFPPPQFESIDLSKFNFIDVRVPQDLERVEQFLQSLDLGESEALALAIELGADAVLIDELAARKAAVSQGLRLLGTLGVLLEAKVSGHALEIGTLIDRLVNELGFFVSSELKQQVLRLAGE